MVNLDKVLKVRLCPVGLSKYRVCTGNLPGGQRQGIAFNHRFAITAEVTGIARPWAFYLLPGTASAIERVALNPLTSGL